MTNDRFVFRRSSSCAPLPATSAYFTTSEPKAKLLNRYHSNQNILMLEENGENGVGQTNPAGSSRIEQPLDSELLIKKKVCLSLILPLPHKESMI